MWIKEPSEKLELPGALKLNFLYNSGKFFYMDNHLAALYVWLQHLNIEEDYYLLHIDQHFDLIKNCSQEQLRSLILNPHMHLEEILSLKIGGKDKSREDLQLIKHDNYIRAYETVKGRAIGDYNIFATHNIDSKMDFEPQLEPSIIDVYKNIFYWTNEYKKDKKWILNIDLDYFFTTDNYHNNIKFISDEYIKEFCKEILKSIANIEVVSIALSPELTGGWKKSIELVNKMNSWLETDFEINEDLI